MLSTWDFFFPAARPCLPSRCCLNQHHHNVCCLLVAFNIKFKSTGVPLVTILKKDCFPFKSVELQSGLFDGEAATQLNIPSDDIKCCCSIHSFEAKLKKHKLLLSVTTDSLHFIGFTFYTNVLAFNLSNITLASAMVRVCVVYYCV